MISNSPALPRSAAWLASSAASSQSRCSSGERGPKRAAGRAGERTPRAAVPPGYADLAGKVQHTTHRL